MNCKCYRAIFNICKEYFDLPKNFHVDKSKMCESDLIAGFNSKVTISSIHDVNNFHDSIFCVIFVIYEKVHFYISRIKTRPP